MPIINWTRRARADMVALAVYSDLQYGEAQRKKYLAQLHDHLASILIKPRLDRPHPEKPEGLMKTKFKAHMVFYQRSEIGEINVVRILGGRMDFYRHL